MASKLAHLGSMRDNLEMHTRSSKGPNARNVPLHLSGDMVVSKSTRVLTGEDSTPHEEGAWLKEDAELAKKPRYPLTHPPALASLLPSSDLGGFNQ